MDPLQIRLLIINPNSSTSVTDKLASIESPGADLTFFTGPADGAPPSIDDEETAQLSATACLPKILELFQERSAQDPGQVPFHGVLVACYSQHPLVPLLRDHLRPSAAKVDSAGATGSVRHFANTQAVQVLGILEASVALALMVSPGPFGIVTTGAYWETVLAEAVAHFLGSAQDVRRFSGVVASGVGVLDLHDRESNEQLQRAVSALLDRGASTLVLGCAGMSQLGQLVEEMAVLECGRRSVSGTVIVIDAVRAGVELLAGAVRATVNYP